MFTINVRHLGVGLLALLAGGLIAIIHNYTKTLCVDERTDDMNNAGTPIRFELWLVSEIALATQIKLELSGYIIEADPIESRVGRRVIQECKEVLEIYPSAFLGKAKLKSFVACSSLSVAGQRATGFADIEHGAIYIDVLAFDRNRELRERFVHHELFHLVDHERTNGRMVDESWNALNSPNYIYPEDWSVLNQWDAIVPGNGADGFLNRYAEQDGKEDRAEVFAFMMSDLDLIRRFASTDPIVRAKAERMREIVYEFCPDLGADYAKWGEGREGAFRLDWMKWLLWSGVSMVTILLLGRRSQRFR